MATTLSVAMVSCKKETPEAMQQACNETQTVFSPENITDMNAYLKGFKKQMQESKGDETMGLEEAAWHLSCLANIDFCRINVEHDDFLFDTIEMQVNITDGVMLMRDFCKAYEQMSTEIQQFKKGFNHLDQNMYFVKVSIGAEGNAKIAIMTSYIVNSKSLYNHQWYYSDIYEAIEACDEYYSEDSTYVWNGLGATELQRVLNIYEHHENGIGPGGLLVICFIPSRDHTFDYTNTYDPYEVEFDYLNSSRVFAKKYFGHVPSYTFEVWELCYLLDSYLGLGYDFMNDHLYSYEFPVNWTVTPQTYSNTYPYYKIIYHNLHVEYGRLTIVD